MRNFLIKFFWNYYGQISKSYLHIWKLYPGTPIYIFKFFRNIVSFVRNISQYCQQTYCSRSYWKSVTLPTNDSIFLDWTINIKLFLIDTIYCAIFQFDQQTFNILHNINYCATYWWKHWPCRGYLINNIVQYRWVNDD